MMNINTVLSAEQTAVMRAVWCVCGWATVDEIEANIDRDGFTRNKIYKILRELAELDFVVVKKCNGRNYYARRINPKQYYRDYCENPKEFLQNEQISVSGVERLRRLSRLQTEIDKLKRR